MVNSTDFEQYCARAQDVITIEANAILALSTRIQQSFAEACELIIKCRGRVVVTGVGKSGHIAKKIAATLASTGTPAFFMHPGEALHGDFGMITVNDLVIALSKSGESAEIVAIIPFMERLQVPLITITGNTDSTLANAATINLDVTVDKEACPLDLAPTASTTAALVMGDAIAMALLDKRGFSKQDFALSHPGGSLGRRLLLKVKSIMHHGAAVPIVNEDTSIKEALLEMSEKKLGMTTIINSKQQLVGIYTDGDVRRTLDQNIDINHTSIGSIMSSHPKTIAADILAAEALELMQTFKITSLVIVNDQQYPIGVVHIHDLLKAGL